MAEVEVRKRIALRSVPGVELAAVGTWHASTGVTTFTPEDLANAVAALECPGVRNPVIKLGHDEETSTSGVRWDGEPAVGWIGNMRMDGAKLIGDYMGMPEWLTETDENGIAVLAVAYPDRSIEIHRPFLCQVGHVHPSVIDAVSLLGIYRPGVGVLKSMQDVYALFTETEPETVKAGAPVRVSTTVKLAAPREPTPIEREAKTDFEALATTWTEALEGLVAEWPEQVTQPQAEALAAQVEKAVAENPDGLGELAASSVGAGLLLPAMTAVAAAAVTAQVEEAAAQGVTVPPPEPDSATLELLAAAVVGAMAASTASAAGRFAAQLLGSGTAKEIAESTRSHLTGLSDRFLRDQLGGALSAAQAEGRLSVLRVAPTGRYYASEAMDADSCQPCADVDQTEFETLAEAEAAYGSGKYVGCLGGPRCRGQLVTVWDAAPARASTPVSTTVRMSIGEPMPPTVKARVSVEDISRQYYEKSGYNTWITAMHVDPLELVVADDTNGKFFRVPVSLNGDAFEFGDAQEVAIVYEDVKAAAAALPHRWSDRATALAAAGKQPDGSDLKPATPPVAPDVSPAGAAIRKMAATATQTPDASQATGSTTEDKEESAMAVDPAKLREALGLAADAPQEEVDKAYASLTSGTPPTPPSAVPTTSASDPAALLAAIPEGAGAIVLDSANYEELVRRADQGVEALTRMRASERDQVLGQAVRDGRFPPAKLASYQAMWDKNADATRDFIALMPKNSVPTMAAVGLLGDETDRNAGDLAYEAMYGKAV